MPDLDPAVCLVDGHWGVYACKHLADSYDLYDDEGKPFLPTDMEDLRGEEWPESFDWLQSTKGINVRDDRGQLWRVEWNDGDLWGINPYAEWCDESDWYVMGGGVG